MQETVISSKKQLATLIKKINVDDRLKLFGRVIPASKSFVLSSASQSADFGMLFPLGEVDNYSVWWDELWESEIVDFRMYVDSTNTVACAAKSGIWDAMPQLNMMMAKPQFAICTQADVASFFGVDVAKAMFFEVFVMGFSVRRR